MRAAGGCEAAPHSPLRSKSTTLILTQHGILIAFTRSSRAARSPDDGWCELTGRWTSWAEGKLGAARYRASTPSSLVTVCVFRACWTFVRTRESLLTCEGEKEESGAGEGRRGGKEALKWCLTWEERRGAAAHAQYGSRWPDGSASHPKPQSQPSTAPHLLVIFRPLKVHYLVYGKTFHCGEKDLHCTFFWCLNKLNIWALFAFMTEKNVLVCTILSWIL